MSDSNGDNPRLDRIEKLIERSERANKEAHARHERAHARHESEMRQLKDHLRRWTILGVKEARNERKKFQSLAAAQERMEDALTALIGTVDALVRRTQ
jgi:hypothetical protein